MPDFNASGVAAVTHGVRAGRRNRTANAPKLDVRGRFNKSTLAQTREKTNLKIADSVLITERGIYAASMSPEICALKRAKARAPEQIRTLPNCCVEKNLRTGWPSRSFSWYSPAYVALPPLRCFGATSRRGSLAFHFVQSEGWWVGRDSNSRPMP